ncbi:MAG: TA system VapC family ribonuclease toxin [Gammaproteobacteria bacterium]
MIVVDVNLLLYVYDAASEHHAMAKAWWEQRLTGTEAVALPSHTILGFLRVGTSSKILRYPLTTLEASQIVQEWLECPVVCLIDSEPDHWVLFFRLLAAHQIRGNLVPDAHLAALAIARGAELCSSDQDFTRFTGLRWVNPLSRT